MSAILCPLKRRKSLSEASLISLAEFLVNISFERCMDDGDSTVGVAGALVPIFKDSDWSMCSRYHTMQPP